MMRLEHIVYIPSSLSLISCDEYKSSSSDADLEQLKKELLSVNENIASLNNEYISLTRELERLNGEKNIINERSKYDSTDTKIHDNIVGLKEKSLYIFKNIQSNFINKYRTNKNMNLYPLNCFRYRNKSHITRTNYIPTIIGFLERNKSCLSLNTMGK